MEYYLTIQTMQDRRLPPAKTTAVLIRYFSLFWRLLRNEIFLFPFLLFLTSDLGRYIKSVNNKIHAESLVLSQLNFFPYMFMKTLYVLYFSSVSSY